MPDTATQRPEEDPKNIRHTVGTGYDIDGRVAWRVGWSVTGLLFTGGSMNVSTLIADRYALIRANAAKYTQVQQLQAALQACGQELGEARRERDEIQKRLNLEIRLRYETEQRLVAAREELDEINRDESEGDRLLNERPEFNDVDSYTELAREACRLADEVQDLKRTLKAREASSRAWVSCVHPVRVTIDTHGENTVSVEKPADITVEPRP